MIKSLLLLLLLVANCGAQSTNVLLTVNIDCNGSNVVTFPPMAVRFTDSTYFNSLVTKTVMPGSVELKAITYCGGTVLNITNAIYTNLFYADLTLSNAVFMPAQRIKYYGNASTIGCSSLIIDIIPSGNPMIPDTMVLICLDGVAVFDFLSG